MNGTSAVNGLAQCGMAMAIAASAATTSLEAQAVRRGAAPIPPRVRILDSATNVSVVGSLRAVRGDTLFIAVGRKSTLTAVTLSPTSSIDTSGGQRWGISRGIAGGTAIGMVVGVVGAYVMAPSNQCTSVRSSDQTARVLLSDVVSPIVRGMVVASATTLGMVVGSIVGALHRGETWNPVKTRDLRVSAAASTPAPRARLSVSTGSGRTGLGAAWTY